MKHIVLLLTTYVALATQAACGNALAIGECVPRMVWLPVLLALIWFADARAILWSAAIGLLADGLSSSPLGTQMFVATITAALGLTLRSEGDERSRTLFLVWQFVVIGTGVGLSHVWEPLLSGGPAAGWLSLVTILGESVYGLVLASWMMILRPTTAHGRTNGVRMRLT